MAFDWSEYLRLARFLQTTSCVGFSQEAAFRCAVSRAYYSAFCLARNYARDRQGFSPRKKSVDHINLIDHFRNRKETKIADNLETLRQWRNHCDYEDQIFNLPFLLNQGIRKAQEILNSFNIR